MVAEWRANVSTPPVCGYIVASHWTLSDLNHAWYRGRLNIPSLRHMATPARQWRILLSCESQACRRPTIGRVDKPKGCGTPTAVNLLVLSPGHQTAQPKRRCQSRLLTPRRQVSETVSYSH